MAVLTMKPHYLLAETKTKGYEDENGNYHEGTTEWNKVCKCDIVPNGKADMITLPDGTQKEYSYTIYLPKDVREFELGERVKLIIFGEEKGKIYEVLGFHPYQLQSKMWI